MSLQCNKWLKWAFIEAAWVAVRRSSYFGGLHRNPLSRSKKANTANTIIARRMCHVAYHLLKDKWFYERRKELKPCVVDLR